MAHANDTIIPDAETAKGYDAQARLSNWLGPEAIFGLTYEYMEPGQSLLDLGIGSGLSSMLFHKAGLRIYGLDGSSEILNICASKNFTVELKQHDLRQLPLPYSTGTFNHIICIAVLNSFSELGDLFTEIRRIMKAGGIFAFTVEEQKPGQPSSYPINRVEVSEKPEVESAVELHRHSEGYITELLDQNHFALLKTFEFVAFKYPVENRDVLFKAYITLKTS
jgi:ubiquinone/menaquinone biosynthesis C-methylase UbiE